MPHAIALRNTRRSDTLNFRRYPILHHAEAETTCNGNDRFFGQWFFGQWFFGQWFSFFSRSLCRPGPILPNPIIRSHRCPRRRSSWPMVSGTRGWKPIAKLPFPMTSKNVKRPDASQILLLQQGNSRANIGDSGSTIQMSLRSLKGQPIRWRSIPTRFWKNISTN